MPLLVTIGREGSSGRGGEIMWILQFFSPFLFFFSPSIPITTSKCGPMFYLDTSNDVFWWPFEPPHKCFLPNSILGGHLPQKPQIFPKSLLFAKVVLKWMCRPNRLTWNHQKWLKWRHSMSGTKPMWKNHESSHRGGSAPQKPHFWGVLWSAKNWKNDKKSTFSDFHDKHIIW